MTAVKTLEKLVPSSTSSLNVADLKKKCYDAMNDDFNTPVLIANLFDAARIINSVSAQKSSLTQADINLLKKIYQHFIFDVMGLKAEEENTKTLSVLGKVVELVLNLRAKAKADKNFALSDEIRNKLAEAGVEVKDRKDGSSWKI